MKDDKEEKARVEASINCMFYKDCLDAVARIGKPMSCHCCVGVNRKDCYFNELYTNRFVNSGYIEYPLRLSLE